MPPLEPVSLLYPRGLSPGRGVMCTCLLYETTPSKSRIRSTDRHPTCSIPGSIGTVAIRRKPTAHRLPHPTAGRGYECDGPAHPGPNPALLRPLRALRQPPSPPCSRRARCAGRPPGHPMRPNPVTYFDARPSLTSPLVRGVMGTRWGGHRGAWESAARGRSQGSRQWRLQHD